MLTNLVLNCIPERHGQWRKTAERFTVNLAMWQVVVFHKAWSSCHLSVPSPNPNHSLGPSRRAIKYWEHNIRIARSCGIPTDIAMLIFWHKDILSWSECSKRQWYCRSKFDCDLHQLRGFVERHEPNIVPCLGDEANLQPMPYSNRCWHAHWLAAMAVITLEEVLFVALPTVCSRRVSLPGDRC